MTIQDLKSQIENNCVTDELIIFKANTDSILPDQYISVISKIKKLEINYVNTPDDMLDTTTSLFASCSNFAQPLCLNVLKTEVYVWGSKNITKAHNAIIVVSKFDDKEVEKELQPYIVNVPELEEWQVRDYVFSLITGVDQKQLDWMITLCGKNYQRLQSELDKLMLFQESEQKFVFNDLINDGEFSDLSSFNIFNLTNALSAKNMDTIQSIYKELDRIDINEFGFLTIMIKNFKNLIMVQLNSNPTTENTGMSSGQLYAIKKLPKVYNGDQLVKIYEILLDIDRKVKEGELPTEIMIDYILIKILSV